MPMNLLNRKENKMKKEILKKIEEFDTIVIARHIGADPDALGSSLGLRDLILENYPKKKVYTIGVYASKFKFMGVTIKSIFIVAQNTTTILNPQNNIPIKDIR